MMNKEQYLEGIKQRDIFEEDILSIANARIREYNELTEEMGDKTDEWKSEIEIITELYDDRITGEYLDAYEYQSTSIPASWIYDSNWKKPIIEKYQKRCEEKVKKDAENDKKREDKEFGFYLRLKEKYEGKNNAKNA